MPEQRRWALGRGKPSLSGGYHSWPQSVCARCTAVEDQEFSEAQHPLGEFVPCCILLQQTEERPETTTSAPGPLQPLLLPFPVQRGGGSGRGYVYKAAKPLLQSEDGGFAWKDTGVRLD